MTKELVVLDLDEAVGIATIRLNRPEKKNALSVALLNELVARIHQARNIDNIRVIILEAAGDTFSAGRDLGDMRESESKRAKFGDDTGTAMSVVKALRGASQITIASVQGYCLGGGMVLLNACDLGIVAEDAKIGMPEILRGSYGRSATPTLFHSRIAIKHAFFISLTGHNMTGVEAATLGVASKAVPAAQLRDYVRSLAAEIASRNPVALEHAKIAAYSQMDLPFDMAVKMDETISHRQRFYTNPLADVEGYLKSQKGGTNPNYKLDDKSK